MTMPSAPPELATLYPTISDWKRDDPWATNPVKKLFVTTYSRTTRHGEQRCYIEVAHKFMANAEVAEFLIGDQLRKHHNAEMRKLGKGPHSKRRRR